MLVRKKRVYGVTHLLKDHSDSERGNPLPPHRLLFPISSKGFLYAPSHRQDSTYHGPCYIWLGGARCSSVVRAFAHSAIGRRIDPSCGEPIELFLVPASALRLV